MSQRRDPEHEDWFMPLWDEKGGEPRTPPTPWWQFWYYIKPGRQRVIGWVVALLVAPAAVFRLVSDADALDIIASIAQILLAAVFVTSLLHSRRVDRRGGPPAPQRAAED